MDTSCEIVILGLFVLDKIITADSDRFCSINVENTDLLLGGPPTFMLFISNILRHLMPVIKQPVLFSYISNQINDSLNNLSIFDHAKSQFLYTRKIPKFTLDYTQPSAERKLRLFDPPREFIWNSFKWKFKEPPILIISSVYQEFNTAKIFLCLRKKGRFLAFDPQGCFRKISSEGEIIYSEWFSYEILSQLDCIKLADRESKLLGLGNDQISIIKQLLIISPKYVIITKGKEGSLLGVKSIDREKASIFLIPAYPVNKENNETGAGDSFLYSFISFLQILGDELEAISYATSLASLLIEYGFNKEKYSLQEIKYRQNVVRLNIREVFSD